MIELGRQFGLYVIKEIISDRDTYACCKAEDPFFTREVALKIYSGEMFEQGEKLPRVEKLMEKLAVLDHPSIAPIYDSGLEGDYFYYTTAYYYGGCLATQLNEPMSAAQVLRLVAELAQALDYALEQQLGPGKLTAEKVFFDSEGRAVICDFGIARGFEQILGTVAVTEQAPVQKKCVDSVAETLRSVGELLLRVTLGPAADLNVRIDDLLAKVTDRQLKKLLSRFLLPGEWRFASYSELLEELSTFAQLAPLLKGRSDQPQDFAAYSAPVNGSELPTDEQAVAKVRRLVAEKNSLQQNLDKAVYERNVAENKTSEMERELVAAQAITAKAQEEANVAWELVAGHKYERWRPVAWTVGGFLVGFLLSGSFGYYYSEQTRDELLAKLKANEELIKTATWRPAELAPVAAVEPPVLVPDAQQSGQGSTTAVAGPSAPQGVGLKPMVGDTQKPLIAQSVESSVEPVKEVSQQWWPVGNEFSPTAAIPIAQIKAALGLNDSSSDADGLSESLRQEVLALVGIWADSWSKQDIGQYLALYSKNYQPELGRSQDEWRDLRRERLTKPQYIELNIENVRLRKIDENRIQVKLQQSYRSDFYQDRILKSINLIKENGSWRILMERSLGMLDDIVGG